VLTLVYLTLALLGCGYVIVASFLGHVTDAGGDDASAADGHADGAEHVSYGIEHGGQGSVSAGGAEAAAFHFPFFSPLAIATLFGALGGFGLIAKYGLEVGDAASLAIAGPAALATSYAVTYASWRVVRSSSGSSEIRAQEITGTIGEVITPIPAGGLGEVSTMVRGQRFTAAAREASGGALPRGTVVTVEQFGGSTLIVTARKSAELG
jgi:membrane protein implicated in regulation of membrane protease activity